MTAPASSSQRHFKQQIHHKGGEVAVNCKASRLGASDGPFRAVRRPIHALCQRGSRFGFALLVPAFRQPFATGAHQSPLKSTVRAKKITASPPDRTVSRSHREPDPAKEWRHDEQSNNVPHQRAPKRGGRARQGPRCHGDGPFVEREKAFRQSPDRL